MSQQKAVGWADAVCARRMPIPRRPCSHRKTQTVLDWTFSGMGGVSFWTEGQGQEFSASHVNWALSPQHHGVSSYPASSDAFTQLLPQGPFLLSQRWRRCLI